MGHDSICVGFRYRARRGPRGEDNRKMALIKRPSMEGSEMEVWGPGCGKVQKDGAHKTTVDGGFRDGSTGARGVEKYRKMALIKRPSMEGSEMEVRGPGVWKSGKVHAEERTGRDGTGRDGTGRDGTGRDRRRRRRVSRTLDAHGARSRESRPRTTRRSPRTTRRRFGTGWALGVAGLGARRWWGVVLVRGWELRAQTRRER